MWLRNRIESIDLTKDTFGVLAGGRDQGGRERARGSQSTSMASIAPPDALPRRIKGRAPKIGMKFHESIPHTSISGTMTCEDREPSQSTLHLCISGALESRGWSNAAHPLRSRHQCNLATNLCHHRLNPSINKSLMHLEAQVEEPGTGLGGGTRKIPHRCPENFSACAPSSTSGRDIPVGLQ